MKIVNRDMTKENVRLSVSNHQIYAEIFSKVHGKWEVSTYFQSYDFLVDKELVESTIRYIVRTWGLKDPQVYVE